MHPETLLNNLNLDQYIPSFKENEIDSSLLPHLDHDLLKDIGVLSVGHRIMILHHIGRSMNEIQHLQEQIDKLRNDLDPIFKMAKDLTVFLKRNKKKQVAIKVYQDNSTTNADLELFKSFRVSTDDPCSKILPDALRKYKISDDWQNYALFIVYGNNEKCLGYDEHPLSVYNALKEKGLEPMFVLKHIKQVQSPQGKHQRSVKLDNVSTTTAIVIYEYMSQREDELTISIGDRVYIQQKSQGWYIVSKNNAQGWVPSGCLLEDPDNDIYNATVASGMATFDYQKVGPNEISMRNGDIVMIKKKYQHWLYVDVNGNTGFVPLCYVNLELGRGRSNSNINTPSSANSRRPSNQPDSPSTTSKFGSILDFINPYFDLEDKAKEVLNDISDSVLDLKDKLSDLPAPEDNNKKIFNDVRRKSDNKAADTLSLIDTVQDNLMGITTKEIEELAEMTLKLEGVLSKPPSARPDDNIRRLTDYRTTIDDINSLMTDVIKTLNINEEQERSRVMERPTSRFGTSSRRLRSPVSKKYRQ